MLSLYATVFSMHESQHPQIFEDNLHDSLVASTALPVAHHKLNDEGLHCTTNITISTYTYISVYDGRRRRELTAYISNVYLSTIEWY